MDQLPSHLFRVSVASKSNLAWTLPRVCIETPSKDGDTRGPFVACDLVLGLHSPLCRLYTWTARMKKMIKYIKYMPWRLEVNKTPHLRSLFLPPTSHPTYITCEAFSTRTKLGVCCFSSRRSRPVWSCCGVRMPTYFRSVA